MAAVVIPKALSPGEELLAIHLRADGIPFEREVRLIPTRKWRWDFVIPVVPTKGYAIEIQGSTWAKGRHSRGNGQANDFEKANAASLLGYRLLFFTTEQVESGYAINTILEALKCPIFR